MPNIIHDGNYKKHLRNNGYVPRDFSVQPMPMQAIEIPLIPRHEWSARIKERKERKKRLIDLRMVGKNGGMIPSLNQGSWPYCWTHSATNANILLRLKAGLPYVALSAFMVGAIIKKGRKEGGWGALALEFIEKHGQPDVQFWPDRQGDLRYDTPEMRANAAQYKMSGGWVDLARPVYDRKMTFDQMMTLLLLGFPVIHDSNKWAHSVVATDADEPEKGVFGPIIWNSWTDDWEDNGTATLVGDIAVPDGATCPGMTLAS